MAIFVPELASPMLLKEISNRLVISTVAQDISDTIENIKWNGKTINFPVYSRVAVASAIADKGSVTPTEIDGTNSTATINHVGSSVKYHKDTLRMSGGSIITDMALADLADAMSLKLDSSLMETSITNAVLKSACAGADALTSAELESGLALFGDKQNADEFACILINSKLFPSMLAMTGFTSTSLTYTTQANGIVQNQCIGYYRGIPVMLSDNGNRYGTTPECKTLLIKKGGLGYALKQDIEFSEQYNNTTFYTTITADTYAAQKVLDTDKVVLIAKTIS